MRIQDPEFGSHVLIQILQKGEFSSQIIEWRDDIRVYKLQRTKVFVQLVDLEQRFLRYAS